MNGYRYLLKDKGTCGTLYLHLKHQHKKYRKRYGSPTRNGLIKNRIFIDERPSIVDEKGRVGDWEIDTIIGEPGKQARVHDESAELAFSAPRSFEVASVLKEPPEK